MKMQFKKNYFYGFPDFSTLFNNKCTVLEDVRGSKNKKQPIN